MADNRKRATANRKSLIANNDRELRRTFLSTKKSSEVPKSIFSTENRGSDVPNREILVNIIEHARGFVKSK